MVRESAVQSVVFSGGESTRFDDGVKALATLDGRPLVAHVTEAVSAASTGPLLLAVADGAQGDRYRDALADVVVESAVETVTDTETYVSLLSGLFTAAERAERPRLFVCACDMPLLSAAGIAALRELPAVESESAIDAVVPVVGGHEQPLHALYRARAVEHVREEVPRSAGLHSLVDRLDAVVRRGPTDPDESLRTAVTNADTREDLQAIRAGRDDLRARHGSADE